MKHNYLLVEHSNHFCTFTVPPGIIRLKRKSSESTVIIPLERVYPSHDSKIVCKTLQTSFFLALTNNGFPIFCLNNIHSWINRKMFRTRVCVVGLRICYFQKDRKMDAPTKFLLWFLTTNLIR